MESGIVSLVLWAITLAAVVCSAAFGVILSYHWFTFGSNKAVSISALVIYSAGALTLVVVLVALAASL